MPTLRSVHTAASVPSHWGDTALPGLAFGTPGSLICSCISFPLPPACPPWLHGRYPLHRCYEGSDSCPAPAAPGQVSLVHQFVLPDLPSVPSPPTEYRPCGGNALLPPQAWPPIRLGGYRRGFGFRAVPAVSSVVSSSDRDSPLDSSVYGLSLHFQLLSTLPRGDAVTFSYWRLAPPERDFHPLALAAPKRTRAGGTPPPRVIPAAFASPCYSGGVPVSKPA